MSIIGDELAYLGIQNTNVCLGRQHSIQRLGKRLLLRQNELPAF